MLGSIKYKQTLAKTLITLTLVVSVTVTVEAQTNADAPANIYTVTNTNDAGDGSLRRAINDANSHAGYDTIEFNIPTSDPGYDSTTGVWTIALYSGLPELSDTAGVYINGWSQEQNQGNTNPDGKEICLDGEAIGGSAAIITITSWNNAVDSLTLINGPGPGINLVSGASENTIEYSNIGTDADGSQAHGNDFGIIINSGASNNLIAYNVVSGNTQDGISISGDSTEGNEILANRIGVDYWRTKAIPNGGDGVAITDGAHHNVVGEIGVFFSYNLISGNMGRGIWIDGIGSDHNEILRNKIGLKPNWQTDIGNMSNGIEVSGGASGTIIKENTIFGNQQHGIRITGGATWNTYLYDNIIGMDDLHDYQDPLAPNNLHGIVVDDGAQYVYLGDLNNPGGNIIIGNGWSGIAIVNSAGDHIIHGNYIGIMGSQPMGNKYHGIAVVNSPDNLIYQNHIAYNGTYAVRSGVIIQGATAVRNTIGQNSIHDNSGLGIELADGANHNITPPLISSASCFGVVGEGCPGCTIDIYSGSDEEGKFWEGVTFVDPIELSFAWTGSLRGENVTVTQTNDQGDTSSFSAVWGHACYHIFLPLTVR